jgi:Fe-S cluster biogenesis protein NfuA
VENGPNNKRIIHDQPLVTSNGSQHRVIVQQADQFEDPELAGRILSALERVRPYLKIDEGDVELVSADRSTGIVEVRLLGSCRTCSLSPMTLRAGVERAIIQAAPEVKRVEAVA